MSSGVLGEPCGGIVKQLLTSSCHAVVAAGRSPQTDQVGVYALLTVISDAGLALVHWRVAKQGPFIGSDLLVPAVAMTSAESNQVRSEGVEYGAFLPITQGRGSANPVP